jgi:hypothetical protein
MELGARSIEKGRQWSCSQNDGRILDDGMGEVLSKESPTENALPRKIG